MNPSFNKWIARALILSMANPALFVPTAMARDTDVYSGFLAESSTSVKPNILLLLDTSDSMNLPEAWREREDTEYDSHVEYLWNDLSIIVDANAASAGEITATDDSGHISTAATPSSFSTKLGFWHGATLEKRRELWQAARKSAKLKELTESGDELGPRYTYRNYNDLSWIYWLPAGTSEDDPRLRSPSWNRFRGYIKELGDGIGGSDLRGGPTFKDTSDYRTYNQCGASLTDLTPSTVFVPSEVAKNSGKYLGQQWARWEPYLNLSTVGNSTYPGSSANNESLVDMSLVGRVYPKGYVDSSSVSSGDPANNPVSRDSYPRNTSANTNVGAQGLPIRYNDGTAKSGWDAIKADAGGFVLQSLINAYSSQADLDVVKGWYGLPTTTDVNSSLATDVADSKFIAWKGNRDSTPEFGKMTGVPAYYDVSPTPCSSTTGPKRATCIDKPTGADTSAFTLTKNATCKLSGTTDESDAWWRLRQRGGSCVIDTITTSGTDINGPTTWPSFSDVPNPSECPTPTTENSSIRTKEYSNCWRGYTEVTAATTCSLQGNEGVWIGNCEPSGSTSVNVGNCAWSKQSSVTVGSCAWANRQTKAVGTCAWSGRTAQLIEGVGYKASGGTCQENGSTTNCNGVADNTIYSSAAAALAGTGGCTNTVAAGSYEYGGTCAENGATTHCSISGGTNVLGGTYTNVNATCSNANNPAAGTYSYGGACEENGSTASCKVTGGTELTIRGNTQTFNRTCSNINPNVGITKTVQGDYASGGTCSGYNNTCTTKPGASFIVRGTNYTGAPTCTNGIASGWYVRGGTCQGTNSPCQIVNNYGGSTITYDKKTWYSQQATCTQPSGSAQGYYSSCQGTMAIMPDIPPGGNAVWTNNTPDACVSTKNTVTINGKGYTNYSSCTDKPDEDKTCTDRYGTAVQCSTSCGNATPTSLSYAATSQGHNYYRTYNFKAKTDYLVHECKADDGVGSKFMHYSGATLREFDKAWNATISYANSATGGVADNDATKVDMYSVNYLNWKFGPKGPNGKPIGRKIRLQIAKDVLVDVIGSINGVRIGLMTFNQMEKAEHSSGAHLASAVKDLEPITVPPSPTPARTALINSVNAITASSATPLTESLYEAYRYFRGDTPWFGGSASGTNYTTLESRSSMPGNLRYVTEGVDISADAIVAGAYKSPIAETCQNNLVILVSDGAPENDTSANAQVLALPTVGSVSVNQGSPSGQYETPAGEPYGPADKASTAVSPDNYVLLDELSHYMANVDARPDMAGEQTVKVSTVKFGVEAPILDNAATAGGGQTYSADSSSSLEEALLKAIRLVTVWQPQGSMPAINFTQTTGQSDDVYLAAFSPSSNVSWPGTIKKYRFGFGAANCGPASCGSPLVCLTGNSDVEYGACKRNVEQVIEDPTLGIDLRKIRPDAVSLWIPETTPDAGSGSKGGTGQVLVSNGSPDTRNLYTYIAGSATSFALSDAGNVISTSNAAITKSLLGDASMTDAQRDELIAFAQGSDGVDISKWRIWPHYDSAHSAPLVDQKTGTTVYYLTSDGVVHAVEAATGLERWSFMVEEGLSKIVDFKENLVGEHLEVADGNLMQVETVDGKQLLVFGMRRGGRAYYALDVTDPDAPQFAWKISEFTTGYSNLGQAWSTPQVAFIRGQKDGTKLKPVLIFGGGYDPNQDLVTPGTDVMGNSVFVADAADGALIREISTTERFSIPSDVLAVDTNGDASATVDRLYVGDMGGNLWRMDLDDGTPTNPPTGWSAVRLAKLSTVDRPNKLFNKPTVASVGIWGQKFDAVFVGGGDMQHPTARGSTDSGAFFMVKDFTVGGVATQMTSVPDAASVSTPIASFDKDFVDMSDAITSDLVVRGDDTETDTAKKATVLEALKLSKGYVINLTYGRKVSSYATVVNGEAFFGVYFPRQDNVDAAATQCVLGGYGEQWGMDALTATVLRDSEGNSLYAGGYIMGYSAGPGAGLVIVTDGERAVLFGNNWEKNSGTPEVGGEGGQFEGYKELLRPTQRVFWYSVPEQQ